METDDRYYFRRACEEFEGARRAVTPAARRRRRELAETFLKRVDRMDATRIKTIFELQSGIRVPPDASQDQLHAA
ncbi:hypothetical protein [Allosphingosinicella sp.]|jgi:Holliday junction resolvase-like predicted endonuclease|uniref:hypothetical protein n=1 Tax=Allosphingosinicella sp. TaxID=2823234 RepID=UPI002EDD94B4